MFNRFRSNRLVIYSGKIMIFSLSGAWLLPLLYHDDTADYGEPETMTR